MSRNASAMITTVLSACLLSMVGSGAYAQPAIDGSWRALVTVPSDGEAQLSFDFRTNDGRLIGTLRLDDGAPIQIKDGRIAGDVITFKHIPSTNEQGYAIFVGKVQRDAIVFAFSWIRGPVASDSIHFTAKRVEQQRKP